MVKSLNVWHSACAAVVGRAHETAGGECQDAVGSLTKRDATAIALADGAGSAAFGGAGSKIAVEAVLDIVTERFDEISRSADDAAKATILGHVLDRLRDRAAADGARVHDFATTLLFVGIRNDEYIAGHIGDGVIAQLRDDQIVVLSHPQRGEHANETYFVTSAGADTRSFLARGALAGTSAFALMSDGTQTSLYDSRQRTMGAAMRPVWGWLDSNPSSVVAAALEKNMRDVFRERTMDDCSLALLRRVTLPASELTSRPLEFQLQLLQCRSPRSLATRISVLHAIEKGESLQALAERSDLAISTLRKHARVVEKLLQAKS